MCLRSTMINKLEYILKEIDDIETYDLEYIHKYIEKFSKELSKEINDRKMGY